MKFLSFMTEVRLYNENEINHKSFHGTYSIWQDIFFIKLYKTISMTFKRLKCTQTMEMKQNQTFWIYSMNIYIYIYVYIQILHLFYLNISKYFNDFQNQNFSILRLKWIEATEIKQNQTFFYRTYSNLTLFFIGLKILKYVNDFYYWQFSILLQKWALSSKVK